MDTIYPRRFHPNDSSKDPEVRRLIHELDWRAGLKPRPRTYNGPDIVAA
ncbi:MAG: hypothetical protein IT477_10785 [Rhodanobacteraceae bacterium]|nr:hypothetical protein [Rhodanobacteraceae bacterium]